MPMRPPGISCSGPPPVAQPLCTSSPIRSEARPRKALPQHDWSRVLDSQVVRAAPDLDTNQSVGALGHRSADQPGGTHSNSNAGPQAEAAPHMDMLREMTAYIKAPQAVDKVAPNAQDIGPLEYKRYVDSVWPSPTPKAQIAELTLMETYKQVKATGLPNYMEARIPLKSNLNIGAWRQALDGYHDSLLCDMMQFGWPSSYTAPKPPTSTDINHPSAHRHMDQVNKFVQKELAYDALAGPFDCPPFAPWTQLSPIMTRAKKDTVTTPQGEAQAQRIIVDLSYPVGNSVNDGIARHFFQGDALQYNLPTVEDAVTKIKRMGKDTWLWKADLSRAYRQQRVDPLDWPLLGIKVQGKIYVDLCPSFGCRASAACQQRVAMALTYLMRKRYACDMLAYVDDFIGFHETREQAQEGMDNFITICHELGLDLAPDKLVRPTRNLEWLGIQVDTANMLITIPHQKLGEVLHECTRWHQKTDATRREIQSLVGRLAFVSQCIPPARRYMARLLATLRSAPQTGTVQIDSECQKDIDWFRRYAAVANGRRLITPIRPRFEIECDACLIGAGGFSDTGGTFYNLRFPKVHARTHTIAHNEAVNAIVAIKTLMPRQPAGLMIRVTTDNMATRDILSGGKARDPYMAACAREIHMIEAEHDVVLSVVHAPGDTLVLADALSRVFTDKKKQALADKLVAEKGLKFVIPHDLGYIFSPT